MIDLFIDIVVERQVSYIHVIVYALFSVEGHMCRCLLFVYICIVV